MYFHTLSFIFGILTIISFSMMTFGFFAFLRINKLSKNLDDNVRNMNQTFNESQNLFMSNIKKIEQDFFNETKHLKSEFYNVISKVETNINKIQDDFNKDLKEQKDNIFEKIDKNNLTNQISLNGSSKKHDYESAIKNVNM